jgi:hypothetical protein
MGEIAENASIETIQLAAGEAHGTLHEAAAATRGGCKMLIRSGRL